MSSLFSLGFVWACSISIEELFFLPSVQFMLSDEWTFDSLFHFSHSNIQHKFCDDIVWIFTFPFPSFGFRVREIPFSRQIFSICAALMWSKWRVFMMGKNLHIVHISSLCMMQWGTSGNFSTLFPPCYFSRCCFHIIHILFRCIRRVGTKLDALKSFFDAFNI